MVPTLQQRFVDLDGELIGLVKPINVLKYLNWPDAVEEKFLEDWHAGRPSLPDIELHIPDWTDLIAAMDRFVGRCDGNDAITQFLRRMAGSYAEAARMLMAVVTSLDGLRLPKIVLTSKG